MNASCVPSTCREIDILVAFSCTLLLNVDYLLQPLNICRESWSLMKINDLQLLMCYKVNSNYTVNGGRTDANTHCSNYSAQLYVVRNYLDVLWLFSQSARR